MDTNQLIETFEAAIALIFLIRIKVLLKQRANLRNRRPLGRLWTRMHNTFNKRQRHSWFTTIMRASIERDLETFYKFTRMSPQAFFYLVRKLNSVIKKKDTRLRKSITVGERLLAITLFFLGKGDSIQTVAWGFRIGCSTAQEIVLETSKALYQVLAQDHLEPPDTDEWTSLSYEFAKTWNLPNCVGAIDGKHIAIQCPANSGSDYYNYKQFFSIVLMAVCDAKYRFTLIDVGAYGREGDKQVYSTSEISKSLEDGSLGLPGPAKLPFSSKVTPHFLVGDDAFPLKTFMMKPYPGRTTGLMNIEERVFNYRLSRARRVVENAFGILANRWRIFRTTINASPEHVEHYTKASIVLHNFLIDTDNEYCGANLADHFGPDGKLIEGGWRKQTGGTVSGLTEVVPLQGRNYSREAKYVRDSLKSYCFHEGSVPWQFEIVNEDGYCSASDEE